MIGDKKESSAESDGDGWINWSGGECPVPAGTLVAVRLIDGHEPAPRRACAHRWLYITHEDDNIVAYRVVQPAPPSPAAVEHVERGKTLRDEFAMATLTGIIARSHRYTPDEDMIAEAYGLADAMMRARTVTRTGDR